MPFILAVLAGAVVAVILVRNGLITTRFLVASLYAVLGAVLGIFALRILVGTMGIGGAVVGATIGGVLFLYFAQRLSGPKE